MKLVCALFTLYDNAFCYFFQASKEDKTDNDNDFKISWATHCSRIINEIFEFIIFSHSLNLFHF